MSRAKQNEIAIKKSFRNNWIDSQNGLQLWKISENGAKFAT
jgi:hypothetical protein